MPSEIYRWFTDPAERRRYPEHDRDRQSRSQVANLRAAYGTMRAEGFEKLQLLGVLGQQRFAESRD